MRLLRVVMLVLAVLLAAGFLFGQSKPATVPDAPKVEAPKSIPASADFLATLDQANALFAVITDLKKEAGITPLEAKLKQLSEKLNSMIPNGYTFNTQTKSFEPVKKAEKK
jgi:hypothetical protein